jgi:hypothetical protein
MNKEEKEMAIVLSAVLAITLIFAYMTIPIDKFVEFVIFVAGASIGIAIPFIFGALFTNDASQQDKP